MGALLEVRGIVTRFGAQTVHAGLDMQVEEGEVFGVIGGSGAGKSVLLRTMLEHLRLAGRTLDELALLKVRLVGLPLDAAVKYPAQLSGGMIKRAALAR